MDLAQITFYFTKFGSIAIFVMVLLEYMNLPGFPAGVIMPLAGIMASKGNINFFWVMVITVAAGLIGSLILYGLGRKGGDVFLRAYVKKFPKQEAVIFRNLEWIRRKGSAAVFLGKLFPMVRTLISIPAGVVRMDITKYIVSSTLGILIWNFVFIGAGYLLGDEVFRFLG